MNAKGGMICPDGGRPVLRDRNGFVLNARQREKLVEIIIEMFAVINIRADRQFGSIGVDGYKRGDLTALSRYGIRPTDRKNCSIGIGIGKCSELICCQLFSVQLLPRIKRTCIGWDPGRSKAAEVCNTDNWRLSVHKSDSA